MSQIKPKSLDGLDRLMEHQEYYLSFLLCICFVGAGSAVFIAWMPAAWAGLATFALAALVLFAEYHFLMKVYPAHYALRVKRAMSWVESATSPSHLKSRMNVFHKSGCVGCEEAMGFAFKSQTRRTRGERFDFGDASAAAALGAVGVASAANGFGSSASHDDQLQHEFDGAPQGDPFEQDAHGLSFDPAVNIDGSPMFGGIDCHGNSYGSTSLDTSMGCGSMSSSSSTGTDW